MTSGGNGGRPGQQSLFGGSMRRGHTRFPRTTYDAGNTIIIVIIIVITNAVGVLAVSDVRPRGR